MTPKELLDGAEALQAAVEDFVEAAARLLTRSSQLEDQMRFAKLDFVRRDPNPAPSWSA